MVNCMIVDDEPLAIELLKAHISQTPDLEVVATAENPIDAIHILKDTHVDLLFLDIQMPVLTGIELVKTLQNPPGIIFTTAYRDYAVESYDLNVIDYLMKPITYMRFLKAVNKYMEHQRNAIDGANPATVGSKSPESIYVNVNKKFVKVIFDEINYVESVKDYIHIHINGETVITKNKISDFANALPGQFLRIHRSFIVNRHKITAFTAHDVEIGVKEIPIGASYKDDVMQVLR